MTEEKLKLCRGCKGKLLWHGLIDAKAVQEVDNAECEMRAHQELLKLRVVLVKNKIVVHLEDVCALGQVHKRKL